MSTSWRQRQYAVGLGSYTTFPAWSCYLPLTYTSKIAGMRLKRPIVDQVAYLAHQVWKKITFSLVIWLASPPQHAAWQPCHQAKAAPWFTDELQAMKQFSQHLNRAYDWTLPSPICNSPQSPSWFEAWGLVPSYHSSSIQKYYRKAIVFWRKLGIWLTAGWNLRGAWRWQLWKYSVCSSMQWNDQCWTHADKHNTTGKMFSICRLWLFLSWRNNLLFADQCNMSKISFYKSWK